ncbi:3-(3-hydroxy-phenyl)propionate hydroxylase [Actinacidiphila yanglinensis]|uniref:3-(3-hydroxy-phenyl)propionate hydroxylase n=1 Tax=Actinacidiphila yanglinensis TaxID=310779 RepID=A0A1H5WY02_9ACTN|nr:FAD-dependent monooxygenase [Actinacidiphila yanglinensis]SEG04372.1 3-(3-hydroxy-phenyl)propionate hydroxylase [Actinacidiphila yanglinensis]
MDPVIVAGAGPVGLTLALALAGSDVPVILLDEAEVLGGAEGLRQARTSVLGPATAALVERLGYGGLRDDGATWTGWRTLRRRTEALRLDFGADPAGAPVHVAQHLLEQGLRAALSARGAVRIVSGCRVDEVEQDARGVTVHTRGAEETWWRGSYLVGCDGPRSTVRKLLGVRFPGRTAVDRHAVVAVRTELPEPGVALLHRDPPGAPVGQEITARPLPDGLWRMDWLLPVQGRQVTSDALVERLRAALTAWCGKVVPYQLVGSADYPVHQRLARAWRVGRIFLAGDAAHLMGALGAQSVEEGMRDAENLAWKLSLAFHHGASDLLLDSYEAERRGAVGTRLRATDQALPLLRSNGALQTVRHTLLSGSARGQVELLTDSHLGRGATAAAGVYGRSPLALPAPRGGGRAGGASSLVAECDTRPGEAIADVPVTALDGTVGRLRDRLGRGLVVVLVAPGTGVWESRHWLTAGLMPRLASAVAALPTAAELLVAETYPGATAHTVLLIRPDGHLVAAMVGCRPAELYSYADLARGGAPAPAGGRGDTAADASRAGGESDRPDGDTGGGTAGHQVSGRTC